MSSSGRYQSRVLSFLSQQSLKLRDRLGQAFRHTQVAAIWGTQILLYPIYAVFQSTRLVGKQLRQTVRQIFPQLQSSGRSPHPTSPTAGDLITSDTPLQEVLGTLQTFELPIQIAAGSAATAQLTSALAEQPVYVGSVAIVSQPVAPLTVRGIASEIATRHLVLVTPQNETLDILTMEQQHYLFQRLIWALAHFWRTQRQLQSTYRARSTFLPLPLARETQLAPVRWFNHFMIWLQTSPVAAATNLFHEAELVQYLQEHWHDQTIVGLPEQAISPQLKGTASPLASSPQPWWEQMRQTLLVWVQRQAHPPAIDPWQTPARASQLPPSPQQPSQSALPSTKLPALPEGQTPSRLAGWTHQLKVWTAQVLSADAQVDRGSAIAPTPASALTQTQTSTQAIASPVSSSELRSVHPADLTKQPKPDELIESLTYIETQATLVGYEKHPLERMLQWLDLTIVWVEKAILRVWQWLSRAK
jgi:hypothetical protein